MAYSEEALQAMLRRKRQYEALGGKLSTQESEGIIRGVLSTEAAREIEASKTAKDEASRREYLNMQKQNLGDQALSGYLQLGITALGTETGKKAIGKVGEWLGLGGKATPISTAPSVSIPSSRMGTTPAIAGGGAAATAVSGLGLSGIPLATASAASEAVGMEGILGAIPSATEPAVTATPGIVGVTGQVALPAAIGSVVGGWLGSQPSFQEITPWGGEKTEKMMGGAIGGAAAGAVYGSIVPGVGTVIGGIIGGVIGFVGGLSVICTELYRQGYITSKELALCSIYKLRNIDHETFTGYMRWAPFVVNAMKKSRFVSWLLIPLFLKWAKEMMHIIKPGKYNSSIIGKTLLNSSIRISKFLGRERRESWAGISAEL